ncbi:MAG: hypothetical protein HDT35_01125 [Clostridiales bacterium]|nr:hypothetical protein [Clostridiales bacterium]
MKKFFDRLRRWLIKKQGGYTEQFTPIRREITRTADVPLQKVQAQISVQPPDAGSPFGFERYCKSRLLELLLQELYQSGFILWESQNDIYEQKVNVRATLRVVNANDMPRTSSWGE